jgi:hypothetical protein
MIRAHIYYWIANCLVVLAWAFINSGILVNNLAAHFNAKSKKLIEEDEGKAK